jgi:hypothetical protein
MLIILQHLSSETADVYSLVLSAEGIDHQVVKSWSGWSIRVSETDAVRAIVAVDEYRRENPETPGPPKAAARTLRQASW